MVELSYVICVKAKAKNGDLGREREKKTEIETVKRK